MHFLWSNKITRYFEFIYQRQIGNRNRIFLNLNHILSKTHQLTPHFFRVCAFQKSPLYFQEKLMRVSKNGVFPRAAETMKKFSVTKLVPAIIWTAVIYYMTFDGQITAMCWPIHLGGAGQVSKSKQGSWKQHIKEAYLKLIIFHEWHISIQNSKK